ncbi:unnamed protein product [Rhizoctonia solani]|uniref:Uncharacterized protein n=1 Tax=Rhizoctonia solani TaxID=456999 RepID=A0A8H3DRN4_9AGAM|nr:unnamed protein product [Rhizoctonia solani]
MVWLGSHFHPYHKSANRQLSKTYIRLVSFPNPHLDSSSLPREPNSKPTG